MWKQHPVTVLFRQYLEDCCDQMRKNHLARWEFGDMIADVEVGEKARLQILREIITLDAEHINNFYDGEPIAAEIDQD